MLFLVLPKINPTILTIGNFEFRWYSLAYILGIVFGWLLISYFNKRDKDKVFTSQKVSDDFYLYVVLGVLIGGRLGYVLFYNTLYYLKHPLQILAIWQGGMSFHGGLIGVIIAIYLICQKNKIGFWKLADLCAVVAPIGLFLGRIANFVNNELYGRTTNAPWAIIFPDAGNLPRHPSQLYEALLEGLLLFLLLFSLARFTKIRKKSGLLSGVFLTGYAVSRIFVECFREPDYQIGYIAKFFTIGQILTFPVLLFGLYLITKKLKNS